MLCSGVNSIKFDTVVNILKNSKILSQKCTETCKKNCTVNFLVAKRVERLYMWMVITRYLLDCLLWIAGSGLELSGIVLKYRWFICHKYNR